MIFWKEWQALKGRFLTLSAVYGITLLLLPFNSIIYSDSFDVLPISLLGAGAALVLIPMILGMDAYVIERDEETEDFLLSKPVSWMKLLVAKVGLRLLLTFILTVALAVIALIRISGITEGLYLSTPPYTVWYVIFSIVIAQLVIVLVTSIVSVRAPYQSTSLIIGGSLGAVIAGVPILTSSWQLLYLQAPWGHFYILLALLLLSAMLVVTLFRGLETGRSRS